MNPTGYSTSACGPRFGFQRRHAASAVLLMALGLGGCSQSEEPDSFTTSDIQPPDTPHAKARNPARFFTQTRNTLVQELNRLSPPGAVSNLDTEQVPGESFPEEGHTAWRMGTHQYTLQWSPLKSETPVRYMAIATIVSDRGEQTRLIRNVTLDDAGNVDTTTYSFIRHNGDDVRVKNSNAVAAADQLFKTIATLSRAVSGMPYTPESDWSLSPPPPSATPSASPSASPTPAPSDSIDPSAPPSETQDKPDTAESKPMTLVVSSFNVAGPHLGAYGHKKDLQAAARSGAHIIGLQESGEDDQIPPALRAMGAGWKFYRPDVKAADHTAIVWNSNVVERIDSGRHFLLPRAHLHDGGKGGNEYKWADWVKFRFNGKIIRVVNTHMLASKFASRARHQRFVRQIHELAAFLRSVPEDEILLLTGDFNDHWDSADLKPIRDIMVPNWQAMKPELRTHKKRRIPIDIVWLRPTPEARFKSQEVDTRRSDHRQLKVEIAVPG